MLSEVWPMAIPLRKRDGSIRAYALVDADDYEVVARHRWYGKVDSAGRIRVQRWKGGRGGGVVKLHRELPEVDHRNGETLDNRRANLRVATRGQNAQNLQSALARSTSRVRGVTWDGQRGKWKAQVQLDKRHYNLGRFDDLASAGAVCVAFRREHMPYSDMDKP